MARNWGNDKVAGAWAHAVTITQPRFQTRGKSIAVIGPWPKTDDLG